MMIDREFPLIDLHRHLDGSVRLETILEVGNHYGIKLPANDVESLRPFVQVSETEAGVMAFIARFEWMTAILVNYDVCRRVAYENVQDAFKEGLDYVELRFSPWFMADRHQLDPFGVVEAVCDGVEAGERDFGVKVGLTGIISRTYGVETAWKEVKALASQKERLVALDLAGDEAAFPAELFGEHFKKAREYGWNITAHAGESSGPGSIWAALRKLGARRIGHGVAAVHDPELLAFLAEHEIGIECNLTSNIQTRTVPDYGSHPMKKFMLLGLLATLNTDDPGISGIDLPYEYNVAAPAAGLSSEDIHQAQRNALQVAFLSKADKDLLKRNRLERSGDKLSG